MEEGFVGLVVETLGYGVVPHDAFSGIEVNEAEPVVLFDASPFAYRPVRVNGDAIAAKHQHSSEAGRGPIVWNIERRVVDASRCYCEDFAIRWDIVKNGALFVV